MSLTVTPPPGATQGLSSADAAQRLASVGPNELPVQGKRSLFALVLDVLKEPMFLMLVAAGALYFIMGEPLDGAILLGSVVGIIGITVFQEARTERALDALRELASPHANVIRGGVLMRVLGREVVPGDMMILAEGERVPADGVLRVSNHVAVNESLLTGESVPVTKTPSVDAKSLTKPGGDASASLYSGTFVTSGQGTVEVFATGPNTELGKIGNALSKTETERTRLQIETGAMVRVLAMVGLSACVVVAVGYAISRGGSVAAWKQGLLAGITMAMSVLPEEFPVIMTVFLAFGAWRLSKNNVLTRRMPAVETLGAATVLCVDKTGTLTLNQMSLRAMFQGGNSLVLEPEKPALSEPWLALLGTGVLASKPGGFDPMDVALHAVATLAGGAETALPAGALVREYPLSPELLAFTQVWDGGAGADAIVASKGAPETMMSLCNVDDAARTVLTAEVARLGALGYRVLGAAQGAANAQSLPENAREFALQFVGLLAFEDPLRATVPSAVKECLAAGVRVVMITGDSPSTAQSIAHQAGISGADAVLTGAELDALSDAQLAERVVATRVFARVVPEQKLRIVNALKAHGDIVAMTGDGVNDAPALKAAHIGIAMGKRGTDVAREAASLVLLDDDFSSIVAAIRLGRRIYDNIQKAVVFTLAVHVPIAGLSMLPVFFSGWPMLLLPVHIVFLELIVDPSCSLIFEGEEAEADIMSRPPRAPSARLYSASTIAIAVLQGLSVFAGGVVVFLVAHLHHSDEAVRALVFCCLVVAILFLILVNRSRTRSVLSMLRSPNAALQWVVLGATSFLAVALLLPGARRVFHFAAVPGRELLIAIGAGAACLLWYELLKWHRRAALLK